MPRRNLKNSNIDCKDKETQHSNLRTNQGYQPLHLEAKLGPYDLCFAPLNVSENKMVPMCNTQLDFICHEYGIHNFFIKNSGQTWLLFTCYLWGWIYSKTWSVKLEIVFYSENFRRRMNNTNVLFIQKSYQALTCETKSFTLKAYGYAELQSQKCQTGEKYFLFITMKTFGEEWTTKRFSSSKSHQALTCENKSFTLKAYGPADRITPKSEVSNWRLEKLSGEEQQNVFFIEKLPSVNVRNQEFSC